MNRGVFALNKIEFVISTGGSSFGTRYVTSFPSFHIWSIFVHDDDLYRAWNVVLIYLAHLSYIFSFFTIPIHSEFIKSQLGQIAKDNAHIQFKVTKSNITAMHPKITGSYINGYSKSISLRNKTPTEILEFFARLKNSRGNAGNMVRWASALSNKPSLQGAWSAETYRSLPATNAPKAPTTE